MTASDNYTFGELLKQFRARASLSQQEVARRAGVHRNTITGWEQGNYLPKSRSHVQALADAFYLDEQETASLLRTSFFLEGMEQQHALADEHTPSLSPVWSIPYARNPHFTGRDDLLEHLAHHLSPETSSDGRRTRRAALSQPQAVKGLGGIGKTQIAVEYAYRAREQGRYTHTFWINAASEEAILTSFQTLAEQLPNFSARDEKDQHKLIAAILRWLQACPDPWLAIFDNADELTLVQPYLPGQGQGSILLTTRAHAVSWLANSMEVEPMGLVEGTRFLLHRTGRLSSCDEESNEATNIVIALGGFPLALDQAGAYIEETGCSFPDYQRLYEQHRATLLARRGKQSGNYPAPVATTWELSLQKIEQTQPAATELLRLCAFLSPDHIPEELMSEGAAQWPPMLQQAVTASLRFNELLEALLAFSLIKRQGQERMLSLHRLVQVVQLDHMEQEEQCQWAERVVRVVNGLFPADPEEEVESWPQCLRYLEQVQACDALIQQYHLQLPEAADLLNRAGVYLRAHASYSLAESVMKRGLALAEHLLGPEHLQVASLLNNLGWLYYEQGHYEQAEPLLQRALHIREQALGPQHPQIALPLNNLGNLYLEQGHYEQAEPLYQRALHIWEQALGPQHPQIAYPLNNLGLLYLEQGHYEQAEPLYQRALHIQEQALGPQHPHLAHHLNGLANLARDQGQYEQANALYQRALTLRQQQLSPQHPHVAETLQDLARLRQMQQHLTEALSLYQQTLTIREQVFGVQHSKTIDTRQRLCTVLHALGRMQEAAVLEQAHLDQIKRENGQESHQKL